MRCTKKYRRPSSNYIVLIRRKFFDFSAQVEGQEATSGFVIADEYDSNVEKLIVFVGDESIISPKESKINTTKLFLHPSRTTSVSDKEE